MNDLWSKLEPYVRNGRETRKVELKRDLDIGQRPKATKLAQLITAMANTPGGTGYILLGVIDARDRAGPALKDAVCGVEHDSDGFERRLQQLLADATEPVPPVHYKEVPVPGLDRRIGVIVVEPSQLGPHELCRRTEPLHPGFFVRRGAETFPAKRAELEALFKGGSGRVVLINFTHIITPEQITQIHAVSGLTVAEVIDVPVHFDDGQPYGEQIDALLEQAGLTAEEWQTLPLIVNIAAFSPIAAMLLAAIHGRAGFFPSILRLRRASDDASRFEVAELIQLQGIRNASRALRNQ